MISYHKEGENLTWELYGKRGNEHPHHTQSIFAPWGEKNPNLLKSLGFHQFIGNMIGHSGNESLALMKLTGNLKRQKIRLERHTCDRSLKASFNKENVAWHLSWRDDQMHILESVYVLWCLEKWLPRQWEC